MRRPTQGISSDEEPLIPSGRNVVPRLSGAEFAGDVSHSQNVQSTVPAIPGALVDAGRDWSPAVTPCVPMSVDPLDSHVSGDVDHGLEVSVFDILMDSDEELGFEENWVRGNSSTVPGVPLQNRFSPLVESPIVRRRPTRRLVLGSVDASQSATQPMGRIFSGEAHLALWRSSRTKFSSNSNSSTESMSNTLTSNP